MPIEESLKKKGEAFRALHDAGGCFVMPNAWDIGSAILLQQAGFASIATTSAGVNYSAGVTDYDYAVSREDMIDSYGRIARSVETPCSGDLENGYGDDPETVAETIRLSIEAGMVGGGIEDHSGDSGQPLYDVSFNAERIRAARAAADASGVDFTLTARAECFLVGHEDPLRESIRRLNAYREAGADCLYAPGVRSAEGIGTLTREVDGPVNVVMGLSGAPLSLAELTDLGVRRVSVGGALFRAAYAVVRDAGRAILDDGRFDFAENAIPDAEFNALVKTLKDR